MTSLAACTIVSKNYLPFARVLVDSFFEHHPDGRFFVLLVDRVDGAFDPEAEKFTVVEVEELENIPDLPSFIFKYSLLECNTAVKPFFLEFLFERYELPNLVYFDPDILITGSLDELAGFVAESSIVLTPHLLHPIDDSAHPGEQTMLQNGAYNLGFIALRGGDVAQRLLRWWQNRLYDHCIVRLEEGLFVDQKWVDLVPGLFGDFHVISDPGYNVAYWNLNGRRVTLEDDEHRVNGRPLIFFHFSGVDPDNLHHVSKHQDRFVLSDIGEAAGLYRSYSKLLIAAGYYDAKPWPYAFGTFDNGVRIPDAGRRLYYDMSPESRQRFGDPFRAGGDESLSPTFFEWLRRPRYKDGKLSRLLRHLYEQRADLVRIFPDVEGRDYMDYCSWLHGFGRYEVRLDEAFLEGVHRETRATLFTLPGLKRRIRNRLKRVYHSEAGKKSRFYAKRLLGHRRYHQVKKRVRPAGAPELTPVSPIPGGYRLPPPTKIDAPGVNIIGYFQAETGMGEAARALAHAFETTGIPITLHSLDLNVLARRGDKSFEKTTSDFRYDVNLFVVNADQIVPVYDHLGAEAFAGRFNIGYWLWELEIFPDFWNGAFDLLHEVWTPSSFCVDAIARRSPVPVRRVPIPVVDAGTSNNGLGRDHFGLSAEAFAFLFTFNFLSYFERKNPLALIRAFKKAFGDGKEAVLVLKTSQSDFAPDARERLDEEIGEANVVLLDEYFERAEIAALTAACNSYVSLHRSEGYGLTLAEAMLLEKPVIATAYSGNVDFFNLNTGYPVRYRLVELEEDEGPYPAHARWAEPDVDHAAELMRRVFERRDEAGELASRGRQEVLTELSHAAVGRRIEECWNELVGRIQRAGPKIGR